MPNKNILAPLLLAIGLLSCHTRSNTRPPTHSFYYWRSVFSLSPEERQSLENLHIKKLYVKFFDVAWNEPSHQANPVATLRIQDTTLRHLNIVPVVFITNETLLRLDTDSIPQLADNIATLIGQLEKHGQLKPPNEIQLDCDWTATTKDRYFALITHIRQWLDTHEQRSCSLSATIRLYQCKYIEKAGVPPVAKGLLMCYNMGNLKNPAARNSILDPDELEKYVSHLSSYPLPLDVALPTFDWKVLFHDQHYTGIIQDLPTSVLKNNPAVRADKDNYYTLLKDTTLQNYKLVATDRLRDEQSDYEDIYKAAKIISNHLKDPPSIVILYHLSPPNLSKYSNNELEKIFDCFH